MEVDINRQHGDVRNAKDFLEKVTTRSYQLIETGIWEGMEKSRLSDWIKNVTHVEPSGVLAACLLDNLVYRTRPHTNAIIKELLESNRRFSKNIDLVEALANDTYETVWAAPVLGLHQPPTKSGPYILRVAQRLLGFKDKRLTWPFLLHTLPKEASVVLLFDDFCGSGDQFSEFVKENRINELHAERPTLSILYLVVAAHEQGLKKIKELYPYISIRCIEMLSDKHNFFHSDYYDRYKNKALQPTVMSAYNKLAHDYGIAPNNKISINGYGDLGLSYAFSHATPNNTLPIFWYSSNKWTPLLDR